MSVSTSSPQATPAQDPKEGGPKPDFPQPSIPPPGLTDQMRPRPDHGEESYRGLGRLAGRVALVTGSDSGIGKAVAIAFAREGADVVVSHLPEEEPDGADVLPVPGQRRRVSSGELVLGEHLGEERPRRGDVVRAVHRDGLAGVRAD